MDTGDEFTKTQLEQKKEKTLALIKPDAFLKMGDDFIVSDSLAVDPQTKNFREYRSDSCRHVFFSSWVWDGRSGYSTLASHLNARLF